MKRSEEVSNFKKIFLISIIIILVAMFYQNNDDNGNIDKKTNIILHAAKSNIKLIERKKMGTFYITKIKDEQNGGYYFIAESSMGTGISITGGE
jgi:hypothetical protein